MSFNSSMKIPFLSSFFKKKQEHISIDRSKLITTLESVCQINHFSLYSNLIIYNFNKNYNIPYLILDPSRGFYIFKTKDWSYEDLKDATISKSDNKNSTDETISYNSTNSFIKKRLKEITGDDDIEIYNYLLMQNLSFQEYQKLDISFKELLPEQKILFNDSLESDIKTKLTSQPSKQKAMPDETLMMANLLVQYQVLPENQELSLAIKEQINFIDSDLTGLNILCGDMHSGKTTALLLKVLRENLRNPELKITIIEPTIFACKTTNHTLQKLVERSDLNTDLTSIEIITPIQLINKHHSHIGLAPLDKILHIDKKLMSSNFYLADLLLCDDSDLLSLEFINYIKHIQKKDSLLLVSESLTEDANFRFYKNFRDKKLECFFKQGTNHINALRIISNILKLDSSTKILIVGNYENIEKIYETVKSTAGDNIVLLEPNNNLSRSNTSNIILCAYTQINAITPDSVILLDTENISLDEINYAINMAKNSTFILYNEQTDKIQRLKEMNA